MRVGVSALLGHGHLSELGEGCRVVDGHVGHHLAVELEPSLLEAGDQARVAGAVHAASGVDAGNPQRAEIALAQLAADVRVLPRLPQDVERLAVAVLAATEEAFGLLKNALVTTTGTRTTFYSGHGSSSRSAVRKKEFDAAFHGLVDHVLVAQAAALFTGFPDHIVLRAAFRAANAAAAADLEPLGSGSIRLHFRHYRLSTET